MDTKIAGKRTVQCDVSQRSFPKCLSVSAFIAYREQHRHSLDLSWHRGCVLCLALRMGFATGALHSVGQVHGVWDREPYPTFIFLHISYMRAQRLYQSVLVTQSLVNKN